MDRLARSLTFVLLLAAALLGASCGISSDGRFNTDEFWKKQAKESQ